MGSFSRGFKLIGSSWRVLKADPKLLAFPALSLVGSVLLLIAVASPFAIWPDLVQRLPSRNHAPVDGEISRGVLYGVMFLFYFASNFVIVFFNAALVASVMTRLRGETPTVTGGLAAAARRLPQILAWAAFAASIGMILKALEERVPVVGKIILRIIGTAWAVVTTFVVPVLALEKLGPIDAVKRSAGLITKSWGENLAGGLGIGGLTFLLILPGIGMIALGMWLGFQGTEPNVATILIAVGLAFAYFIAIGTIMSALKQIFVTSAYLYASEGRLPEGISEDLMTTAFRQRRPR